MSEKRNWTTETRAGQALRLVVVLGWLGTFAAGAGRVGAEQNNINDPDTFGLVYPDYENSPPEPPQSQEEFNLVTLPLATQTPDGSIVPNGEVDSDQNPEVQALVQTALRGLPESVVRNMQVIANLGDSYRLELTQDTVDDSGVTHQRFSTLIAHERDDQTQYIYLPVGQFVSVINEVSPSQHQLLPELTRFYMSETGMLIVAQGDQAHIGVNLNTFTQLYGSGTLPEQKAAYLGSAFYFGDSIPLAEALQGELETDDTGAPTSLVTSQARYRIVRSNNPEILSAATPAPEVAMAASEAGDAEMVGVVSREQLREFSRQGILVNTLNGQEVFRMNEQINSDYRPGTVNEWAIEVLGADAVAEALALPTLPMRIGNTTIEDEGVVGGYNLRGILDMVWVRGTIVGGRGYIAFVRIGQNIIQFNQISTDRGMPYFRASQADGSWLTQGPNMDVATYISHGDFSRMLNTMVGQSILLAARPRTRGENYEDAQLHQHFLRSIQDNNIAPNQSGVLVFDPIIP